MSRHANTARVTWIGTTIAANVSFRCVLMNDDLPCLRAFVLYGPVRAIDRRAAPIDRRAGMKLCPTDGEIACK
jgi:hypothetical protein